MTIDKAIILAAGMGTRIASGAGGVPKPLLPIAKGITFLDWHLRALGALGVREVYAVGSKATFGARTASELQPTWILNDFPGEISGSGHSTSLAFERGILDGRSRVLLMDADIVYDPLLLAELAKSESPRSKTLVCRRYRETNEEVLVFADDRGVPRVHGKGLSGGLVRGLSCLGEATGVLVLEPEDHALWSAAAAWCMAYSTAKTRSEHEDITQRLMIAGAIEAVRFDDDRRFMECDTPGEYEVVRSVMAPRWLSRLG